MPQPPKSVVMSKKEVGARLKALRQQRGITQVELARILGTFQTVVSAIERGTRGLTLQQAVKLTRALDASPDELLGEGAQREGREKQLSGRLLRRLQRIEELPATDRRVVLKVLDGLLAKHEHGRAHGRAAAAG